MDYENIKDRILSRIKILGFFDFDILDISEGRIKIRVYHKEFMEREGGIVFGGIISMFFDFVMGAAVYTVNDKKDQATINLNIEFIRKARSEYYIFIGEVIKKGRNIVFAEGKMLDDKNSILAKSYGIWFIY